jgi:hypothetical protein
LSQTIENVSLMLGPACDQLNMERFPSQKPFLIMAASCDHLNDREIQLIQDATKIDSSGTFYIYELPFNAFRDLADSISAKVNHEIQDTTLMAYNDLMLSGNSAGWAFVDFDSLRNGSVMNGTGYFTGKGKNKNEVFNQSIHAADTSAGYRISFWMDHISGDLYPRTTVRINQYSPTGTLIASDSYPVSKNLVMIDHDRALVEIAYSIKNPNGRLAIILQNKTLRNKPIRIDDLLIRPSEMQIYKTLPDGTWKNNRIYRQCLTFF